MRYLNRDQVSEMLGNRSRPSIWRDVKEGRLPAPVKIGGRVYWDEQELSDFLENLEPNPST